jgi:hypothetical protein
VLKLQFVAQWAQETIEVQSKSDAIKENSNGSNRGVQQRSSSPQTLSITTSMSNVI